MKRYKEIVLILLIVTCFLVVVSFLGKPLGSLLITFGLPSLNAKFITIIIIRTFILVVSLWGIYKLKFHRFNGFGNWFKTKYFQAWFGILLFCGLAIVFNLDLFLQTKPLILALLIISSISIGLAEEFIFRGTILPLFISKFKYKKNVLIISVLFTSLIFGIGHYINLLDQPSNLEGITNQVVLATTLGMIAGGLILSTNNILFVALLHGIINISLSTQYLEVRSIQSAGERTQSSIEWIPIISIIFILLLLILVGLYLIKRVDPKAVLHSLR